MLHSELDSHPVFSTLLDGERSLFEVLNGIRLVKVDDNVRSTLDKESKLKDNNLKWVRSVFTTAWLLSGDIRYGCRLAH